MSITDEHPRSGMPVLILLKDGTVHTGHFIKNASYKVENVNRWRIYSNDKKGRTVPDEFVADWMYLQGVSINWDIIRQLEDDFKDKFQKIFNKHFEEVLKKEFNQG